MVHIVTARLQGIKTRRQKAVAVPRYTDVMGAARNCLWSEMIPTKDTRGTGTRGARSIDHVEVHACYQVHCTPTRRHRTVYKLRLRFDCPGSVGGGKTPCIITQTEVTAHRHSQQLHLPENNLLTQDESLLGYGAVQSRRSISMFQRYVLPPSSGNSPDVAGSTDLENVSLLLRGYMAPYPWKLSSAHEVGWVSVPDVVLKTKILKHLYQEETRPLIYSPSLQQLGERFLVNFQENLCFSS
jgi:hypothetical protein